jgi:CheY-like chemotaxis protein
MDVVGVVADGATAVEFCERIRPDVVVMDIRMPIRNGIDATKQLRARNPTGYGKTSPRVCRSITGPNPSRTRAYRPRGRSGQADGQGAEQRGHSPGRVRALGTVKTHVSNILAKLSLQSRIQIVVWAYENGVTNSPSQREHL